MAVASAKPPMINYAAVRHNIDASHMTSMLREYRLFSAIPIVDEPNCAVVTLQVRISSWGRLTLT